MIFLPEMADFNKILDEGQITKIFTHFYFILNVFHLYRNVSLIYNLIINKVVITRIVI